MDKTNRALPSYRVTHVNAIDLETCSCHPGYTSAALVKDGTKMLTSIQNVRATEAFTPLRNDILVVDVVGDFAGER